MKPIDRYEWIENYLRVHTRTNYGSYTVDVCDANFVFAYVQATGAKSKPMMYGADRCRQLGRDLTEMHKRKRLRRHRTGLGDMHSMGFPSWVWSYRLPKKDEQ